MGIRTLSSRVCWLTPPTYHAAALFHGIILTSSTVSLQFLSRTLPAFPITDLRKVGMKDKEHQQLTTMGLTA